MDCIHGLIVVSASPYYVHANEHTRYCSCSSKASTALGKLWVSGGAQLLHRSL